MARVPTVEAPPVDQRGGLLFGTKKPLDIQNRLQNKGDSASAGAQRVAGSLEAPELLRPDGRSSARSAQPAHRAGLGSSQTTFERSKRPKNALAYDAPEGSWTGPDSDRVRRRRELYQLREWWRPRSTRPRLRRCGRVRVALEPHLTVRDGAWDDAGETRSRSCSWGGVETCSSVWSCPVCSVRVRGDRARAIIALDTWARAEGWQVSMLTVTVRHAMGDSLERLRRGIAGVWARVQRLTAWNDAMKAGAWFVRALEVTHGAHGWHPHCHVLLVSPVPLETLDVPDRLAQDWRRAVVAELGTRHATSVQHGVDWREIAAGEYIAKMDLAMGLELTDASDAKSAKGASRKPSELLRDAHAHAQAARAARERGEPHVAALHAHAQRVDVARFRQYEAEMVGARLHTASRGLLKFWQAVADDERDEETDVVCTLPMPGELFDLLRDVPQALTTMATAGEEPDPRGTVGTYLRSLGVMEVRARGSDPRYEPPKVLDGPAWADRWECMLDSIDYAEWVASDYVD